MKVVINKDYGGFGLSKAAYDKLVEWGVEEAIHYFDGWEEDWIKKNVELNGPFYIFDIFDEDRSNPMLIKVVEELGEEKASSYMAQLKIVEIPDDVEWEIYVDDNIEWVAEKHRTWS